MLSTGLHFAPELRGAGGRATTPSWKTIGSGPAARRLGAGLRGPSLAGAGSWRPLDWVLRG